MSTHHCQGLGRRCGGFPLGRDPAGARAQAVLLVAGPGKWGTPLNRDGSPGGPPAWGLAALVGMVLTASPACATLL